jgi:hypothetical protein
MPSSKPLDDDYHSDASRPTAQYGRHLSRLTIDEKRTYQKWKRATFIVYGTVAVVIVMVSIAIGPTDTSTHEIHSALAPQAVSGAQR